MGRGAELEGGGGGRGAREGSVGSSGPEQGRNPSKGENFRGLRGKPRLSQPGPPLGSEADTAQPAPPRHRGCKVKCPAKQPLPQGVPGVGGKTQTSTKRQP